MCKLVCVCAANKSSFKRLKKRRGESWRFEEERKEEKERGRGTSGSSETFPLGKVLLNHPPSSLLFLFLLSFLPAIVVVSPKNCGKEEGGGGRGRGLLFLSFTRSLFLLLLLLPLSFHPSKCLDEGGRRQKCFLLPFVLKEENNCFFF